MEVLIARWGNSLGLRIPKDVATRFRLTDGARVDIDADADKIIISIPQRRYRLEELLVGMTPQAMHEAFDWGPDHCREIVD